MMNNKNILILSHPFPGHIRPKVELVEKLSQSLTISNITILNSKMGLLSDSRMKKWHSKLNISESERKIHVSLMESKDVFFTQVEDFEEFHREMSKMIDMDILDQFKFTFDRMMIPYERLMISKLEIVEVWKESGEIENVISFEERLQKLSKIAKPGIKRYLRIRNDPSQTLFDQAVIDFTLISIQSIIAGSKIPCTKIFTAFFRQFMLHYPGIIANSLDYFTKYPNRFYMPFVAIQDVFYAKAFMENLGEYFEMNEIIASDSQCALIQTSSYGFEFASGNTQYFNAHLVGPFMNEKQINDEIETLRKLAHSNDSSSGMGDLFNWIDEQEDIMLMVLGSTMVLDENGMKKLLEGLQITLNENPRISILMALGNLNMEIFERLSFHDLFKTNSKRFKILKGFVPQKGLLSLEKVKIFFTHCGANSVNEALYFGKLLIGFPFAYDQMRVSHAIEEFKVGRSIYHSKKESSDWNINSISKAVHELLYDEQTSDKYKTAARHAKALTRRSGGVSRAAEIVELVSEVDGDLSWGVADKHLTWWQFYCLDIILFYGIIIYFTIKMSKLICCYSKSKQKNE
ncbi:predicted protein [Naegleria gruberi]|uniref:Predicted protein n=1 Tax=Naegleria gruberi TaxID=5762 RepID=D2W2M5_NAEGR|nr:uncharacterized protein NAEGRDRAFT_75642 [Naegleria gruberi]EFC36674.1 predicted protein [Naegleria gruberi]|eukprot:XP_002669418.1 predicted protein [Naegleria gruberi strain NEG-M]